MNKGNSDDLPTVTITVLIQWDQGYTWTYEGPGVDRVTGNFKLPGGGETAIVYVLDPRCSNDYQLLYVNLDPDVCATHEIKSIHVHHGENKLTIIDRNSNHVTKDTPFSIRLVARQRDQIDKGFMSPDPQVTNNPNTSGGGSG